MSIRPLRAADVESYRALRLRGLADHPEAFTSSSEEESAAAPEKLLERLSPRSDCPHDVVLGAFVDEALVGTCGMSVDPRVKARHRGHVFGLHVAREHAGRGIGGALVERLIAHAEHCRDLDALVLTVTADNQRARTLYERHGFTACGCEPGAVRVGGIRYDKLSMIRWLAGEPGRTPFVPGET